MLCLQEGGGGGGREGERERSIGVGRYGDEKAALVATPQDAAAHAEGGVSGGGNSMQVHILLVMPRQ